MEENKFRKGLSKEFIDFHKELCKKSVDHPSFTILLKKYIGDTNFFQKTRVSDWKFVLKRIRDILQMLIKKDSCLNYGFDLEIEKTPQSKGLNKTEEQMVIIIFKFLEFILMNCQARIKINIKKLVVPFLSSSNLLVVYKALRCILRIIRYEANCKEDWSASMKKYFLSNMKLFALGFNKSIPIVELCQEKDPSENLLKIGSGFKFEYYLKQGDSEKEQRKNERKEIIITDLYKKKNTSPSIEMEEILKIHKLQPIHKSMLWVKLRQVMSIHLTEHRLLILKIQCLSIGILSILQQHRENNILRGVIQLRPDLFRQFDRCLQNPNVKLGMKEEIMFSFSTLLLNNLQTNRIMDILIPQSNVGAVVETKGYVSKQLKVIETGKSYDTLFSLLLRTLVSTRVGAKRVAESVILSQLVKLIPLYQSKIEKDNKINDYKILFKILHVFDVAKFDVVVTNLIRLGTVPSLVKVTALLFKSLTNEKTLGKETLKWCRKGANSGLSLLFQIFSSSAGSQVPVRDLLENGYLFITKVVIENYSKSTIIKNEDSKRLALKTLSLMVNIEPTCIPAISNFGILTMLFKTIKERDIPNSGSLILVIPELLYALSLNPSCTEKILKEKIIIELVEMLLSDKYLSTFETNSICNQYFNHIKVIMKNNIQSSLEYHKFFFETILKRFIDEIKLDDYKVLRKEKAKSNVYKRLVIFCNFLSVLVRAQKEFVNDIFEKKYFQIILDMIIAFPFIKDEKLKMKLSNPINEVLFNLTRFKASETVTEIINFTKSYIFDKKFELKHENLQQLLVLNEMVVDMHNLLNFSRNMILVVDWKKTEIETVVKELMKINFLIMKWVSTKVVEKEIKRIKGKIEKSKKKKKTEDDGDIKMEDKKDDDVKMEDKKDDVVKMEDKKDESKTDDKKEEEKKEKGKEEKVDIEKDKKKDLMILLGSLTISISELYKKLSKITYQCLFEKDRRNLFEAGLFLKDIMNNLIFETLKFLQVELVEFSKKKELTKQNLREEENSLFSLMKITLEPISMMLFGNNSNVHANTYFIKDFNEKNGFSILSDLFDRSIIIRRERLEKMEKIEDTDEKMLEEEIAFWELGFLRLINMVERLNNLQTIARSGLTRSLLLHDSTFVPSDFTKIMQVKTSPLIVSIWRGDLLNIFGDYVTQVFVNIVSHIVKGIEGDSNEKKKKKLTEDTVDEVALTQLIAMGFEAYKGRKALVKCRNNVQLAAEWLLTYPEIKKPEKEKEEKELKEALIMSLNNDENITQIKNDVVDWIFELCDKNIKIDVLKFPMIDAIACYLNNIEKSDEIAEFFEMLINKLGEFSELKEELFNESNEEANTTSPNPKILFLMELFPLLLVDKERSTIMRMEDKLKHNLLNYCIKIFKNYSKLLVGDFRLCPYVVEKKEYKREKKNAPISNILLGCLKIINGFLKNEIDDDRVKNTGEDPVEFSLDDNLETFEINSLINEKEMTEILKIVLNILVNNSIGENLFRNVLVILENLTSYPQNICFFSSENNLMPGVDCEPKNVIDLLLKMDANFKCLANSQLLVKIISNLNENPLVFEHNISKKVFKILKNKSNSGKITTRVLLNFLANYLRRNCTLTFSAIKKIGYIKHGDSSGKIRLHKEYSDKTLMDFVLDENIGNSRIDTLKILSSNIMQFESNSLNNILYNHPVFIYVKKVMKNEIKVTIPNLSKAGKEEFVQYRNKFREDVKKIKKKIVGDLKKGKIGVVRENNNEYCFLFKFELLKMIFDFIDSKKECEYLFNNEIEIEEKVFTNIDQKDWAEKKKNGKGKIQLSLIDYIVRVLYCDCWINRGDKMINFLNKYSQMVGKSQDLQNDKKINFHSYKKLNQNKLRESLKYNAYSTGQMVLLKIFTYLPERILKVLSDLLENVLVMVEKEKRNLLNTEVDLIYSINAFLDSLLKLTGKNDHKETLLVIHYIKESKILNQFVKLISVVDLSYPGIPKLIFKILITVSTVTQNYDGLLEFIENRMKDLKKKEIVKKLIKEKKKKLGDEKTKVESILFTEEYMTKHGNLDEVDEGEITIKTNPVDDLKKEVKFPLSLQITELNQRYLTCMRQMSKYMRTKLSSLGVFYKKQVTLGEKKEKNNLPNFNMHPANVLVNEYQYYDEDDDDDDEDDDDSSDSESSSTSSSSSDSEEEIISDDDGDDEIELEIELEEDRGEDEQNFGFDDSTYDDDELIDELNEGLNLDFNGNRNENEGILDLTGGRNFRNAIIDRMFDRRRIRDRLLNWDDDEDEDGEEEELRDFFEEDYE